MSIEFDSGPPPRARRTSAPSLINRIQKPNLLDRLGGDDSQVKNPRASCVSHAFALHSSRLRFVAGQTVLDPSARRPALSESPRRARRKRGPSPNQRRSWIWSWTPS